MRALLLLLLLPLAALAQNHPELDWQVIETAHFRVLYHQGLEEAAQRAALIAEEAYGPVTQLYGYQPGGKVRILIKDYDDYANGAAYYYHDTIEIWATSLDHDFELRGTSDWLRNVITHEFTHIISLGSALKAPQRVPALYLQYFGYQREHNRPDVLVGYPDVLASYPVTTLSAPMWFAEGVAQYQALGAHHDRWDSHRDMILRSAVLSDSLLSFDQMGVFGKCGFGNEFVYDHGYGLVRYIAQIYGDEKLAAICRATSGWKALEIGMAIHQALGVSADQLYRDWYQQMKAQYQAQVQALGALREGEVVVDRGFSNQRPAYSPDGKSLVYLSTRDRQFGPHALVLRHLDSGKEEVLTLGVSSSCSWSPDGRKLVLVRHEEADKYGSRQADLYEYDLEVKERGLAGELFWGVPGLVSDYERPSPRLKRLSRGLRALYPAYSPDGKWIAFVHNGGTHNNLGVMRADGTQIRYLTRFEDGTQLYTPQWSPDGQYLVFSIAREGARDIARLRVDGPEATVEVLVATAGTDRDPVFSAGGRELIFAADFTGIFNLYTYDLKTQAVRPLTNVKGGAFTPTCSPSGEVAFAAYGARGFQIRKVEGDPGAALVPLAAPAPGAAPKAALLPSHPYGVDFLKTSLIPRLLVDKGRFKGGLYVSSGDVLNRQNLFAGVALAPTNGDRDLFALYEYRGWRPTVFLEFNHQRRSSPRADSSEARDLVTTGTIYNLNQLNLGLKGNAGRHGEVALSLTYDRYDASVASRYFDSQRIEWVKQKPFGYTYLQGFDLGLSYRFEALARRRDQEISPRGRQLYFRYDRQYNLFIKGFREGVTFIDEDYLHLFYNQFTLDWKEHLPLPLGGALGLRFFGGWIATDKVDDEERVNNFFDYHLGGIEYMKGYTFYSVEGRKAAMGNTTLRFPILPDLHRRFLHLYFDKVYGAVYGDLGKAWDGKRGELNPEYGRKGPLRDLGAQLRCDLFSYYSMPTRVQADLAYGVDEIAGKSPWKFYLTVLFGYL